MGQYKEIEHSGDLCFLITAKNTLDLFYTALDVYKELYKTKNELYNFYRIINIGALDYESLMVNLINDLIYRAEVKSEIYSKFNILKVTKNNIKLTAFGMLSESSNKIKALTFSKMKLFKVDNEVKTYMVFDV